MVSKKVIFFIHFITLGEVKQQSAHEPSKDSNE